MGLLDFLSDNKSPKDREKEIDKKLFDSEAEAFGLSEEEKEECWNIGITPEEWAEENDKEFQDNF